MRAWHAMLALAALLVDRPARAKDDLVPFVYERAAGAETCPDEAALRAALMLRLGRPAFVSLGGGQIVCTVAPVDGQAHGARIVARDRSGAIVGERALVAPGPGCTALAAELVLALGLAAELVESTPAPTEAPPTVAVAPVSPVPEWPTPVSSGDVVKVSRPVAPRQLDVEVGTAAVVGAAPSPTGSLTAQVGARRGHLSLAVEGRIDIPAGHAFAGGTVTTNVVAGSALACWHRRQLALCGATTVGGFRAWGSGYEGSTATISPFFAVGGRLQWQTPIGERLALRLRLDVGGPLSRTTLLVGSVPAWETPAVTAAAGVAIARSL